MIKAKRRAVLRYFSLVIYGCFIALIIVTGKERSEIVTSNINNVKSIQSSRIVHEYGDGLLKSYNTRLVTSTNEIRQYGNNSKIEFVGTLTGYGPDCPGCIGLVYCSPNPNVLNGNIYYNDKEYGTLRILAADYSIPCGSIIHIENYKFVDGDEFTGIVLDRGSAIVGLTMDLLYPSEADTVIIGRQRDIHFTIERWGW